VETGAARVGVLVAVALVVVAPASSAARGAAAGAELRQRAAALAERELDVLGALTALESRLARAEAELTALRARTLALAGERREIAWRVRVARESLAAARSRLAARLRALYAEGGPDPLAVLLGAQSIADAMTAIDGLQAAAEHDRELVARVRGTERRLRNAERTLARSAQELRATEREVAARARALAATRADRSAYLARIRAERRIAAGRLAELQRQARAPAAPAAVTAAPPPAPALAGGRARTLTVLASAYTLRGATATGAPAGWGTVAVDPSVIPLGTRLTIPGYGAAVAADVGSAIRGAAIDVWFPTAAEASEWGRRVVTITLASAR
jgi:3D (Asp-Asp-Asp) domain-containing protein